MAPDYCHILTSGGRPDIESVEVAKTADWCYEDAGPSYGRSSDRRELAVMDDALREVFFSLGAEVAHGLELFGEGEGLVCTQDDAAGWSFWASDP
jgi:hypothetical protein